MQSKLRKLEEKSKIFHRMQRGIDFNDLSIVGEIASTEESSNIDFKRRKEMYDFYGVSMPEDEKDNSEEETDPNDPMNLVKDRYIEMLKQPHKEDEVLIEDEFGRIRWVKHGSDDHMNHIGSNYRIRQQIQGKIASRQPMKRMSRKKNEELFIYRGGSSEDDLGEST